MKKKNIITIILVLLVVILGGASIYVATQLTSRPSVSPNAPTSKPAAFESCASGLNCSGTQISGAAQCDNTIPANGATGVLWCCPADQTALNGLCVSNWVGSAACTVAGVASPICTPTDVVTCNPDCPTDCGHAASTITTCTDSCGAATTKACAATAACASWTVSKEAFTNASTNTAGSYSHTDALKKTGDGATVIPNETYVYEMWVTNPLTTTMTGVTLTDVLTGTNLDKLTFLDADTGCTYAAATRTVTCTNVSIASGTYGKGFRVKVAGDITDGTSIVNTFSAVYAGQTLQGTNTLTAAVTATTAVLTGTKTAYKDVSTNTPGNYALATEMATVSKGQTYVYTMTLTNSSTTQATGVSVKDSLASLAMLTFVDTVNGCTWDNSALMLTCNTSIDPNQSKTFSLRVRASAGIANGDIISNTANVTYNGNPLALTKDLTVSTVVGCNNTCTTSDECSTGLVCDTTTSTCRKQACTSEDDCTCAVAIIPTATRAIATATAVVTAAPTTVTPTVLPETGVLDIPGVAAFGGGLFMAVVGILLAL